MANYIGRFETAIMVALLNPVLERFKATSVCFQSARMDMGSMYSLYNSLITFVEECREAFENM